MDSNFYKRLQRIEAIAAFQRSEHPDMLEKAYQNACKSQNAEDAAYYARKIRDRLLTETDSRVAIDRLGLAVPSGSNFTAWLSFLRTLGQSLTGSWATYRQALRDLPEQEGFPFDIAFPEKPESEV